MQDNQVDHRRFLINVEDYRVIRHISDSTYGSVFLVQNIHTQKNIVAKIINRRADFDEEKYKKMVNREIGIMIQCRHPTIINFIGYSLVDIYNQNNVTIFMQYGEKGSLFNFLSQIRRDNANGQYNNTIGQIILVGIARGMMYLHQHQIVHRDLKPGNILLDENFQPHITDFGLSKFNFHDQMMDPSQNFGIAKYLAPECINGEFYNKKADVYSFGIIMYEIVTRKEPYPTDAMQPTVFHFLNRVTDEDLRPVFDIPVKTSIKKLIESCWSKNPEERPTFEEIFKKLAYNSNDFTIDVFNETNQQENEDFYMDDVDIEKVRKYEYFIDNPELAEAEMRHKAEIDDLRNQIQQLLDENATLQSQSRTPHLIFEEVHFRNWDGKNPNLRNMRGGQPYYYPVGFFGIGFHVQNFDENTIVAYHGTKVKCIPSILKDGFKLPSELGGVRKGVTQLGLAVFGIPNYSNAVFVSPSIKYASMFGIQRNGSPNSEDKYYIILLQVRIKPNSYTVHRNTTFYTANDPHFNDDQVEWRIANPRDVFPYRVLVKTISFDEISQLRV